MATIRISRRALTGAVLAGTTGVLVGCERPADDDGEHCFGAAASNDRLDGLRVFQQAPPPAHDDVDADYRHWPCTDAATTQDFGQSAWTEGNIWAFVWANRCSSAAAWNRKPNPLPSPVERVGELTCRSVFTTHAKANAATRCQVRYLLGMAPEDYRAPWLGLEATSSDDFVTDAEFREQPGAHCRTNFTWEGETYRVMVDTVLLPAARLTEGTNAERRVGVVLDYEVQDSRRPEVTESFVSQLAHDFRGTGKHLAFLTNPFDAPTQQHTGCTAQNLPRIFADVDYMAVMLWSGGPQGSLPASYATQLGMLGRLTADDLDKVIVNFELGEPGTTLDDARWLHGVLHDTGDHPDKVMFWRNLASQGGDCDTRVNQKISMVCYGE